jgi:hypothetical protein
VYCIGGGLEESRGIRVEREEITIILKTFYKMLM